MTYASMVTHPTITKATRHLGIGGTDARMIADGRWHELYLIKTGQASPPDLRFAWKPRLGLETENLHAWWHGHAEQCVVLPMQDQPMIEAAMVSELPPYAYATFDRWLEIDDIPLELKHTNERNSLRDAADYYMAQLQWQMHVARVDRLRFSIIRGNSEPEWGYVARDDRYIDRLVKQVDAFWCHVEDKEAPIDDVPSTKAASAALASAAKTIPINGFRPYDMARDNAWCSAAAEFVRDKVAAESLKITEPKIRGMIPKDASEIAGGGVAFKRDARGAYRVTIDDETMAEAKRRAELLGGTIEEGD